MIETANSEWLKTLDLIRARGKHASPRGMPTKELLHHVIQWSMFYPVVYEKKRRLSYTFMAAEALWIMSGSNKLDFHPQIQMKLSPYSDDGEHMAGAYGPRIAEQIEWVLMKLKDDPDTRQAVIEIWRPCPPPSKDIPCTIAVQFHLRDCKIYMSVFMRSSDVWMGLPYDMFTFTCLAQHVADQMNATLGTASLTAGSSHLYERNAQAAYDVLYTPRLGPRLRPIPPVDLEPYLLKAAGASTQEKALQILTQWRING